MGVQGHQLNARDFPQTGSVVQRLSLAFPLSIGARVTVGHQAILHGCTVADDCLIGMGARILNGAVIASECIVGAGALITEGKRFETGSLIVGAPARVVRQITDEERALLRASAAHYAEKAQRYAAGLRPVGQPE